MATPALSTQLPRGFAHLCGLILWAQKEEHMTTTKANPPVIRTSAGLRDAIFDEIDAIRDGSSNPTRANAVAKLATGIVETVRMEMEVQRHLNGTAKTIDEATKGLGEPLSLGAQR